MPKQKRSPASSDTLGPRRPFAIGQRVRVTNGGGSFEGPVIDYVADWTVVVQRGKDRVSCSTSIAEAV